MANNPQEDIAGEKGGRVAAAAAAAAGPLMSPPPSTPPKELAKGPCSYVDSSMPCRRFSEGKISRGDGYFRNGTQASM